MVLVSIEGTWEPVVKAGEVCLVVQDILVVVVALELPEDHLEVVQEVLAVALEGASDLLEVVQDLLVVALHLAADHLQGLQALSAVA